MKLNIEIRSNTGKKETKELRKNNKIPAVLYGKGLNTISLFLDYKEFHQFYKQNLGHSGFIFLKLKDKEYRTLIKDVQIDPFSRKVMHIDFQEIFAGQKIESKIPVSLIGDAPGIREGGIADIHLRELEIRCLPKDMPDSFEIDVSHLQIGDSLHVEDIANKFPNVEIIHSLSAPIISIILPKAEVVAPVEEVEEVVTEGGPSGQPKEKEEAEKQGEE